MPYLGYMQLDVEIMGKALPQCGILVIKDPSDPTNGTVEWLISLPVKILFPPLPPRPYPCLAHCFFTLVFLVSFQDRKSVV